MKVITCYGTTRLDQLWVLCARTSLLGQHGFIKVLSKDRDWFSGPGWFDGWMYPITMWAHATIARMLLMYVPVLLQPLWMCISIVTHKDTQLSFGQCYCRISMLAAAIQWHLV